MRAKQKNDKTDIEMLEVDESRLGPTARLSSRQASVLRENVSKSLTPNFLELEPSTTRSSPRIVSVSATREIEAHTTTASHHLKGLQLPACPTPDAGFTRSPSPSP